MGLKIGDRAPDFTLKSQDGASVRLYDLLAKKPVVLFFYPKDNTPGCTKEACAFRDRYSVFQEIGAEVVGISGDSVDSHQQFANAHRLPFTLVSDEGDRVRTAFGVPSTLWVLPGRVTYILNQQGIITQIFDSQLNFEGHIEEALKALYALKGQ
ncbi:MAG: peroxiredoxin [Thermosynechococcaceae cyanobacterium MS004]|nr:peroxiredoxin [Thermosynechococcaceae cyanobacterium MS004]